VVAAKSLLASALVALVGAAAAAADPPTVRINRADQAKAEATLLTLKDFGAGWSGGKRTPSKLTPPKCPGFNPKESDLTVTGHAEARFSYARGSVVFDQDNQVLKSADAVATDFSRVITPKLTNCLAYELKSSDKSIVSATVRKLHFPQLGDTTAAYRGTVVIRVGGRKVTFIRDYVFIGIGRLEYSLAVDAPAVLGRQLLAFEEAMAQNLVKRSGASVA
jgi:hypothetical protein